MKQPHEDVAGTERSDWLLSLDENATTHRAALITLAFHLRSACMVGNPAPVVDRMAARILDPQIGDLVVETTRGRRRDDSYLALGFLVERRQEWWSSDEDWERYKAEDDSLTDAERTTAEAWYVQYGSAAGDICRWTNCSFMVVPTSVDSFTIPAGTRDGNGVTITKDSLLGSLADSGFTLRGTR
jgi:hypothetical protein